jgi:hypothetical protein
MKRLLYWLSGFLPCRLINDGERAYLERYYIGTLFGWRFYLHQFVGSDPDRGLHCHPWRLAFSIILSGWYWEETVYGTRKVRWFNWLTGESKHRVVLPAWPWEKYRSHIDPERSAPCWTLFFHRAENAKAWGFWRRFESGGDGVYLFTPYRYEREGNQADWWLTAPTGRELREAIVHRKRQA